MNKIMPFILVTILLTGTAGASVVDFRDPTVFSRAINQSSFTTQIGGVMLTIDSQPSNALLWWDQTDGFGAQLSYEQDEIEGSELLRLSFSTTVDLASVFLTDLFNESGYLERGFFELDGSGKRIEFSAASDQYLGQTNGELQLSINEAVNFITFSAPGLVDNQNHEFAVGGLDFTVGQITPQIVPLPSSLLLMGSGVFVLLRLRKKLKI